MQSPSVARKFELVDLVNTSPISVAQIAEINNINYSTLKKYKKYAASGKALFERAGRPFLIDNISTNDILSNLDLTGDCISKTYFVGLLAQERTFTYIRRYGRSPPDTLTPLSRVTINRYFKNFIDKLTALRGRAVGIQLRNRPRRTCNSSKSNVSSRLQQSNDSYLVETAVTVSESAESLEVNASGISNLDRNGAGASYTLQSLMQYFNLT
jgi:hypothetical protein